MESGSCTGRESSPARRLLGVVQLLPSRYHKRNTLCFKAERDETRRELEDVSKKAGIAELEASAQAAAGDH
jgi:hypothetical protein